MFLSSIIQKAPSLLRMACATQQIVSHISMCEIPIGRKNINGRQICKPTPKTIPPQYFKSDNKTANDKPLIKLNKIPRPMWKSPECCRLPCTDKMPRFDELYYKPSDKQKRKYQQTWKECSLNKTKPVICNYENIEYPEPERRKFIARPTTSPCPDIKPVHIRQPPRRGCVRLNHKHCKKAEFHHLAEKFHGERNATKSAVPIRVTQSVKHRQRTSRAPKNVIVWRPYPCAQAMKNGVVIFV